MNRKRLEEHQFIVDNLRSYVKPGAEPLLVDKVAELCGTTRRKLLVAIDDCDEMNLNVGVAVGGSVMELARFEWSVENLDEIPVQEAGGALVGESCPSTK